MASRATGFRHYGAARTSSSSSAHAEVGDSGIGLREYLLRQHKAGELSAKEVCTCCWIAKKAGAVGINDLTCDLGSRDQAAHLATAITTSAKSKFYSALVPTWDKVAQRRTKILFPARLPRESFACEAAKAPRGLRCQPLHPRQLPASVQIPPDDNVEGCGLCPHRLLF